MIILYLRRNDPTSKVYLPKKIQNKTKKKQSNITINSYSGGNLHTAAVNIRLHESFSQISN